MYVLYVTRYKNRHVEVSQCNYKRFTVTQHCLAAMNVRPEANNTLLVLTMPVLNSFTCYCEEVVGSIFRFTSVRFYMS